MSFLFFTVLSKCIQQRKGIFRIYQGSDNPCQIASHVESPTQAPTLCIKLSFREDAHHASFRLQYLMLDSCPTQTLSTIRIRLTHSTCHSLLHLHPRHPAGLTTYLNWSTAPCRSLLNWPTLPHLKSCCHIGSSLYVLQIGLFQ